MRIAHGVMFLCLGPLLLYGQELQRGRKSPADTHRIASTAVRSGVTNALGTVTTLMVAARAGQIFATWDNLATMNIRYTLYRSSVPIENGSQLSSAQNLGDVRGNSAMDLRLSGILGPTFLKVDSAATPLASTKGLFVATSIANGSHYYAVTATAGGLEDTSIVRGWNATTAPVIETVAPPQPVWQMNTWLLGRPYDIYVQYASQIVPPGYPVMTNVGSFPHHFAVGKGGSTAPHPMTVWMTGDLSSFIDPAKLGAWKGDPNEWIVSIDDWLPDASDITTCYYGYHEGYDIFSPANTVPTSGMLFDYTYARVKHTVEWALHHLPVDSSRTYIAGISAGAIGALFTSLTMPARFAAAICLLPQCDMASLVWDTDNQHWGTPQSDLPTNDGLTRRTRLHAGYLAGRGHGTSLPILFTFCGKNDDAVGWAEKIPFYDSLCVHGHGGFFFWDSRGHSWSSASPWRTNFPDFSFVTRYRSNLSYPALSNCSANDNPGNGNPTDGAAVGSINGHLDWNDNIVDSLKKWEITLQLKDLVTTQGPDSAPARAMVDVTLRRLQAFAVPADSLIVWENWKDGALVQRDSFMYHGGIVTIPRVQVYRESNRLVVTWKRGVINGIAEHLPAPAQFVLEQNYPNPFNPTTVVSCQLPGASHIRMVVYDLLGREVTVLMDEKRGAGRYEMKWDASGRASGIYICRMTAGGFVDSKKLLLVR
jgi:hypothetical protein